ncbi:MAG: hypothetical protein EOP49_12205 [Sphingobacteriales bacterium]|nr:MAG: hypothetical protein EOP49_12205 [Sphingobacteriales bacterium]
MIREGDGNFLQLVTTHQEPVILLRSGKKKSEMVEEELALHEKIDITGWKTVGTRVAGADLKDTVLAAENEGGGDEKDAPTLF